MHISSNAKNDLEKLQLKLEEKQNKKFNKKKVNYQALQKEKEQISNGMNNIRLNLPEYKHKQKRNFKTKRVITGADNKINENKKGLQYFKLTYLINAKTFKLRKSFCILARNEKEAQQKGKNKTFSKLLCNLLDIHFKAIEKVKMPEDHNSKLVRQHRVEMRKQNLKTA